MAEKFGALRKLGRWLLGRKPKPPVLPKKKPLPAVAGGGSFGHRGIAIGRDKEGERDLSAENVAKWKPLTQEQAEGFMEGEILFVHSTNVVAAQYFEDVHKMMIEFKKGKAYLYSNVSRDEAWQFLQAMSKGSEVWDTYRVRGKGNAKKFRKPFVRIR